MKSFQINENDASQRLDKYILKVTDMPKSLMYKFLRTGHIKVNKKKKDGNYFLNAGDTVAFFINDSFFKETTKASFPVTDLDIVYESADILAINKPLGMKSQPDFPGDEALSEYVKGYLEKKGEFSSECERSFSPALCNRLDVNTTGIVIAAKNSEALRLLNEKIRNREIEKSYHCITCGVPEKPEEILEGYILKDKVKNKSEIIKKPYHGALYVKTGYRIIKTNKSRALLDITLYTGRSHQIRAHMASIGCPIEGDFKYGGGKGTQKLCAYKLFFNFSDDGGKLSYLNGKCLEIIPYFDKEV